MFLDTLLRRNPEFLESVAAAHQSGHIPTNTVVIDADAVHHNASLIGEEARKLGLEVFAMTKQIGRNPDISAVLRHSGITKAVAVDLECGIAAWHGGLDIGHIGHLVQIPRTDYPLAVALDPEYWTLFNFEHAQALNSVLESSGRIQPVLLRVFRDGDTFYPGHEGGFPAEMLEQVVSNFQQFPNLEVVGVTSFPTTLFDRKKGRNMATQNRETLSLARNLLEKMGIEKPQVNSPGTTSIENMRALAEAGATQIEPGHGLTGTTPMHAVTDLPEIPAVVYVTEVSHVWNQMAFVFGGGLYADPVFPGAENFALIADPSVSSPSSWRKRQVMMSDPSAIDYYARIPLESNEPLEVGTTVIFGHRVQTFVTRANTLAFSPGKGMPLGQAHAANGGPRLMPGQDRGVPSWKTQ